MLEENKSTKEELEYLFGEEIASLVEGITKIINVGVFIEKVKRVTVFGGLTMLGRKGKDID